MVRAAFWPICLSANDCMLPAGIVISSGETRRYGWQGFWTLLKRRAQRSPATMEFATLRSEISPLRFATVEMTGVGHRSGQFAPGIDCMLPAAIVISSGGTCRYGGKDLGALMKRRVERSPATMGRATLRSEISPLRFASVEMTGVRGSVWANLSLCK